MFIIVMDDTRVKLILDTPHVNDAAHSTQRTAHSTQHTAQSTQHTAHSTQHAGNLSRRKIHF
jgi:hypothetical protein